MPVLHSFKLGLQMCNFTHMLKLLIANSETDFKTNQMANPGIHKNFRANYLALLLRKILGLFKTNILLLKKHLTNKYSYISKKLGQYLQWHLLYSKYKVLSVFPVIHFSIIFT